MRFGSSRSSRVGRLARKPLLYFPPLPSCRPHLPLSKRNTFQCSRTSPRCHQDQAVERGDGRLWCRSGSGRRPVGLAVAGADTSALALLRYQESGRLGAGSWVGLERSRRASRPCPAPREGCAPNPSLDTRPTLLQPAGKGRRVRLEFGRREEDRRIGWGWA